MKRIIFSSALLCFLAWKTFANDGLLMSGGGGTLFSNQSTFAPLSITSDGSGHYYLNVIEASGTSATTPFVVTGTAINTGTNATLTGTIPAGAAWVQFTFSSGTTTILNQIYTGGTQFYPASDSRTYPAIVYTITGAGSTIYIQYAQ
jgi:hypothetical protein